MSEENFLWEGENDLNWSPS